MAFKAVTQCVKHSRLKLVKVYRQVYQVIRHATEKSFVAVILKVLLVNLLAALDFANVLKKIKKTFGR